MTATFPKIWNSDMFHDVQKLLQVIGFSFLGAGILVLLTLSQPCTDLGRLLMKMGLPTFAATIITDSTWRGAALYEAKQYGDAAMLFTLAGKRASYNLGNARARSNDFPRAIEAYDEALRYNPLDIDAQANRAIVVKLLDDRINFYIANSIANGTAQYGARYTNTVNQDRSDSIKATSSGEGLAGNQEVNTAASLPGNSNVIRRSDAEQQSIDQVKSQARGSASDAAGRGRTGADLAMTAEAPEREARRVTKSFAAQEIRPDRLWLKTLTDTPGSFLKLRLNAEHQRRVKLGIAIPAGSNPW